MKMPKLFTALETGNAIVNAVNEREREYESKLADALSVALATQNDFLAQELTPPYPDDNPKTVVGLSKPGTAAIPPVAILQLGQAMHNGEVKYGRFNWRDRHVTTSVYTDAIDRHMLAFRDGEDRADDSNLHHLAHVMACCAILLDAFALGKINDDRRHENLAANFIKSHTGAIDAKNLSGMSD